MPTNVPGTSKRSKRLNRRREREKQRTKQAEQRARSTPGSSLVPGGGDLEPIDTNDASRVTDADGGIVPTDANLDPEGGVRATSDRLREGGRTAVRVGSLAAPIPGIRAARGAAAGGRALRAASKGDNATTAANRAGLFRGASGGSGQAASTAAKEAAEEAGKGKLRRLGGAAVTASTAGVIGNEVNKQLPEGMQVQDIPLGGIPGTSFLGLGGEDEAADGGQDGQGGQPGQVGSRDSRSQGDDVPVGEVQEEDVGPRGDRLRTSITGPGGGTASIETTPQTRLAIRARNAEGSPNGIVQGGTVSTVDGSNFATTPVGPEFDALRRARQAALERGDVDSVVDSFRTPQEQRAAERRERIDRLRRQANQDVDIASFNDISDRRTAQTQLQQELDAQQALRDDRREAANLRSQRQIEAAQVRAEQQQARADQRQATADLEEQRREALNEDLETRFGVTENGSLTPEGQEAKQFVANTFGRTGLNTEERQNALTLKELGDDLTRAADAARQDGFFTNTVETGVGALLGTQGARIIRNAAQSPGGVRSRAARGLVGLGAALFGAQKGAEGLVDFGEGGPAPPPESAEQVIGSLQDLKEKVRVNEDGFVTSAADGSDTVTFRGVEVPLSDIPASARAELGRQLQRLPERQQQ